MASVGDLHVRLTASTASFQRAMTRAMVPVNKFAGAVSFARRKLLSFNSAILGAVAGGGIAFAIKRQLDFVDSMAKTSDKLGIAVEDLLVMGRAAKLSGVNINTMTMALQRMTRRLSEAGQDSGEAKAAILELGLVAKDVAKLAPDKAFLKIADAMRLVEDRGDRVRLGFKLFDSEGVALINTLAVLNIESFAEIRENLLRTGELFSRIDAAKVELANDAITRLSGAFKAFFLQQAIALAPLITVLADRTREWVIEMGGARVVAVKTFSAMTTAIELLLQQFVKVPKALVDMQIGLAKLKLAALDIATAGGRIEVTGLGLTRESIAATEVEIARLSRLSGQLGAQLPADITKAAAAFRQLIADANAAAEAIAGKRGGGGRGFGLDMPELGGATAGVEQRFKSFRKELRRSIALFDESGDRAKALRFELEGIDTKLVNAVLGFIKYNSLQKDALRFTEMLITPTERLAKEFAKLPRLVEEALIKASDVPRLKELLREQIIGVAGGTRIVDQLNRQIVSSLVGRTAESFGADVPVDGRGTECPHFKRITAYLAFAIDRLYAEPHIVHTRKVYDTDSCDGERRRRRNSSPRRTRERRAARIDRNRAVRRRRGRQVSDHLRHIGHLIGTGDW